MSGPVDDTYDAISKQLIDMITKPYPMKTLIIK